MKFTRGWVRLIIPLIFLFAGIGIVMTMLNYALVDLTPLSIRFILIGVSLAVIGFKWLEHIHLSNASTLNNRNAEPNKGNFILGPIVYVMVIFLMASVVFPVVLFPFILLVSVDVFNNENTIFILILFSHNSFPAIVLYSVASLFVRPQYLHRASERGKGRAFMIGNAAVVDMLALFSAILFEWLTFAN